MPPYTGDPNAQDISKFENGMTGECLCGNIKVTIKKKELFSRPNGHLCHCANCRKYSGCVASNNMVIEKDNVQVDDPKGLLKLYEDSDTGSGMASRRRFCSNCGSPICSTPTDSDEQYVLPLGIFPRIPQPEFELFAAHRHDWEARLDGTKLYKFMTASGEL